MLHVIASKAGGDTQIHETPLVDPDTLTRWNICGLHRGL